MDLGTIKKVSGPLVVAEGMEHANLYDVVYVSDSKLIGEIIEMRGGRASIQVYEETSMLGPGEPVFTTNEPLSVELGPGLAEAMFDGIQRPLDAIRDQYGDFIDRGCSVNALDRKKKWSFTASCNPGDALIAGDIIGTVQENVLVEQRIMVPPNVNGVIKKISSGEFKVDEVIGELESSDGALVPLTLMQKWPVRRPRPISRKMAPTIPMITGQRVIDTLFPIMKGGTACVPGPFGSGKTVIQHQFAKWSDVEIVVYVGCGERGNEMTDVLNEFPELKDPRSGEPLIKRTVLIANTSNMPVAAREASIYTGITIAEYFRDMGYSVALMADSTSRWAEALREMSGRLEEMPGEEGYPAYLGSRLSEFYERSGMVECLGTDKRIGTLTAIGAVSPPGGDLSEPVTQSTLRIVKVFWGLDANLAYRRHFPAINWLTSYSLYKDVAAPWFEENVSPGWNNLRTWAMRLLQEEAELEEIVRLVGYDALSDPDKLTMEISKSIREDYLQQNSFHESDSFASLDKQYQMLLLVNHFSEEASRAVEAGVIIKKILELPVRERIARAKYMSESQLSEMELIRAEATKEIDDLIADEGGLATDVKKI